MLKLFIFEAVGSYFGGMAMATAENEKEAFEKIKQFSIKRDKGNQDSKIYEHCYFSNLYPKDELDKMDGGDIGNGWVCVDTANVDKEIVFCQFHDG